MPDAGADENGECILQVFRDGEESVNERDAQYVNLFVVFIGAPD